MFFGKVIHGDGIGKKYGFPTANIDLSTISLKLKSGVYAVRVVLNKKDYQGALAINDLLNKVEIHLLDYEGKDFYDSVLEFEPLQKVSEMQKYENETELLKKIADDIKMVEAIFKK